MKRNAVEWVVLAVSVVGIVVLVGTLVAAGLSAPQPANPTVELRHAEARQGAAGWIIPATIRNDGDEAAEEVLLEAATEVAGSREVSELVVQFLPAGTSVEAAFAFTAQPTGAISVRLVSFRSP